MKKARIDLELVRRGFVANRTLAKAFIMEGRVHVDGIRVDKAGSLVGPDCAIAVAPPSRIFASRGGHKIAAALDAFDLDVTGRIVLDIGAGTGGFTDCLLKQGAAHVYALDVGRGQIDHRLRIDPRVTVIERLNARFLEPDDLPGQADLAVMDVSFISVRLIFPRIPAVLRGRTLVSLIKPQFEVGRGEVGKGGIVRDPEGWRQAVRSVLDAARTLNWKPVGLIPSPVPGAGGNREFLVHLDLGPVEAADPPAVMDSMIEDAIRAASEAAGLKEGPSS